MNSLMSWFQQHVHAVLMDENPDIPVIEPVAVLWGLGPIGRKHGHLCLDSVVVPPYCDAAGVWLAAGGNGQYGYFPVPEFCPPFTARRTRPDTAWTNLARCARNLHVGDHCCTAQQWLEQPPAAATR